MLMEAALSEFRNREIARVKVAVAAANQGAIRFYQNCGFRLAATRTHHGLPMNIYDISIRLAGQGSPAPDASATDSAPGFLKPSRFSWVDSVPGGTPAKCG
jgi:hypothetical protein